MATYIAKPPTFEAVQYDGTEESIEEVKSWFLNEFVQTPVEIDITLDFAYITFNGIFYKVPNHAWLIRTHDTGLLHLSDDEFHAQYQKA